ncbi:fimbria/pilus periplasmic chaperone [Wenzhouxiangella sp. XN79A]|uniref:fimbrial biogenesis chaperone n=1 Tax=Wenzhouxiangella sp. XN79A TaxID=2724193 RepID=UPI001F0D6530|nr:fimbria/pilus periplasmic chaperone [Wenzhouxiangella sp. XN79A]
MLALVLTVLTGPVAAFNFTPIDATLRPAGSGATQTFSVDNPSPSPVAVEITMHTREMTPDGEDILAPADDLFTVYPSQLILQPNGRQSVRVQWNGPAELDRERAFRLIAEELPIDLGDDEDQGAGLDLLVRYVASVYVQPQGASARLSIEPDVGDDGVVLVVRNAGTMRAVLRDEDYALYADGRIVELDAAQLDGLAAVNVLAGHTRRLAIPASAGLADRELEVRWLRDSD